MKVEIIDVVEVREIIDTTMAFARKHSPNLVIPDGLPVRTIEPEIYVRQVKRVFIDGKLKNYIFKDEAFDNFMKLLENKDRDRNSESEEGFVSNIKSEAIKKYINGKEEVERLKKEKRYLVTVYKMNAEELNKIKSHKFLYKLILFFDKFKK